MPHARTERSEYVHEPVDPHPARSSDPFGPPRGAALRHRGRHDRAARGRGLRLDEHHHLHLQRARRDHLRRRRDGRRRRDAQRRGRRRLAGRRRAPAPACAGGRQRPRRRGQHDQHRHRRGHPAHGRPDRQARLRLDQPRARRGPARVGLLRPARPQGTAPLRGDRPVLVARHVERRAGVDRGRRVLGRPGLDLPRHPAPVDLRRRGQRRPVPRGTPPARRLRPRVLLPPVARADPGARPRRARHPHAPGARVLRRALRLPVPAGALRPGLRAQPRRRHGELGLRDLRRRPAVPHSPDARAAQRPRRVHLPRDGAHVVRRPGHHAVVGRPLAQRGVRVLGGQLGHGRRVGVHRAVGHLPRRLQAHGLRDGHEPGEPPDPQRGGRRVRRDVQLRRDHLRQGPERPAPARRLHRRGGLRRGPARLLQPLRVLQHPARRPDGLLLPRLAVATCRPGPRRGSTRPAPT